MHHARDELLADAALAGDQHLRIGVRDAVDLLYQLDDLRAASDDLGGCMASHLVRDSDYKKVGALPARPASHRLCVCCLLVQSGSQQKQKLVCLVQTVAVVRVKRSDIESVAVRKRRDASYGETPREDLADKSLLEPRLTAHRIAGAGIRSRLALT